MSDFGEYCDEDFVVAVFPDCVICENKAVGPMVEVEDGGIAHSECARQIPPCVLCKRIFYYSQKGEEMLQELPIIRDEKDQPVHHACFMGVLTDSSSDSDEEQNEYEKFLFESGQRFFTEVFYNVAEQCDELRSSLDEEQNVESNNDVYHIPPHIASGIRDYLKGKMKGFVFRRVGDVVKREECRERIIYNLPGGKLEIKPEDCESISHEDLERLVEEEYSRFIAFTTEKVLRDNDPYRGKKIYLSSGSITQPDIEGLTFRLCNVEENKKIPPQPGDLVCMVFDEKNSAKKSKNPRAKLWWICSEQFLRFWTLVMYDNHPSFEGNGKEPRMEERLMSGNRLNTNSYLKYVHACLSQNIQPDPHEVQQRFRVMRTEEVSKKWCHVYSALVLMVRYGKLPDYTNIPINRGGNDPVCKTWSLPHGFILNVFRVVFGKNPALLSNLLESFRINYEINMPIYSHNQPATSSLTILPTQQKKKTINFFDEDFPLL